MNKQEVIKEVKTLKPDEQNLHEYQPEEWEAFKDGFDDAKCYAELAVEKLDEPEKPVLTKAEAEWVENLTEFFDTPDALYYITRCGYSEYPFTFDFWGDTYELPIEEGIEYGELNKIRERLVNAVVYGYEVEKEKLYTVEIPNPNASGRSKTFLARKSDGKLELYTWTHYTSIEFADDWKQQEYAQLTEDEIKEDYAWAWEARLAKEVEE